MQELVIADLIKLMRTSVNDLSLHYVNAGQEALKFCRDPLALMEVRSAKTSQYNSSSRPEKADKIPSAVPSSLDQRSN